MRSIWFRITVQATLALTLLNTVPLNAADHQAVEIQSPDDMLSWPKGIGRQYIDTSGELTADEVLLIPAESWEPVSDDMYYGYTDASVWIKVPIITGAHGTPSIAEHHGIDEFDLWIVENDRTVHLGSSGWANPRASNSDFGRGGFNAIPLLRHHLEPETYLIRLASSSSLGPRFVFLGSTAQGRVSIIVGIFQGLGIGLMMMLMVFSPAIYHSRPRKEFFRYFLLVIVTSILTSYISGFAAKVVLKNAPQVLIRLGVMTLPLYIFAAVHFFRSILDLENRPFLRHTFRIVSLIALISTAITATIPVTAGYLFTNVINITVIPLVLGLLIAVATDKNRISFYVLAAWSLVLIVGLIHAVLNSTGLLAETAVFNFNYISVIGFLIQNALLGAAIVIQTENLKSAEESARIAAEKEVLKNREKVIQADRTEGLAEVVSVVSHELATPLGNARLMGTHISEDARNFLEDFNNRSLSEADLVEYLEETSNFGDLIGKSLSDADRLLQGYKNLASDGSRLEPRELDLSDYMSGFLRIVSLKVRSSPHKIVLDETKDLKIRTIPGYLTQILMNLVNNALLHAFAEDQSGEVTIRTGVSDKDGAIEISIIDNGMGISEALQSKIFEMHFTTALGKGGTGLGLAISRSLAEEKLLGNLFYERRDQGSRFILRLRNLACTGV